MKDNFAVYNSERLPIKSWCIDLEEKALQQAKNLANHPTMAQHVALMPDAHCGYGVPIGGVIAVDHAVIPNAVGTDIGCVDADTEFLTTDGWERIADYRGGSVLQYDSTTKVASFISPQQYIVKPADVFLHFKTKYGINQVLSKDHKVYGYRPYGRQEKLVEQICTASELKEDHERLKLGSEFKFETTFTLANESQLLYSDALLRVLIMCAADGSQAKIAVSLNFKKTRKIKRARMLLRVAKIEYSERTNGDVTNFYIKNFWKYPLNAFWLASPHQLKIIAEEVLKWDGNEKDSVFYTRKKEEADFIHYVFAATGHRSVMRHDIHKNDGKLDYRVFAHTNTITGLKAVPKSTIHEISADGELQYCFTVPTGFWVMRRGGNIAITGNCGMAAIKTNRKVEDIDTEQIKKIVHSLQRSIPMGFSHHQESQESDIFDEAPEIHVIQTNLKSATRQLGTLGGGNHFIEIQSGSDGYIWLMLHSGSRNLGYRTAKYYNQMAMKFCDKWHSNLPPGSGEDSLAFLPFGVKEAADYWEAMTFCTKFAFENRKHMMNVVKEQVNYYLACKFEEDEINIHHNYAKQEHHFGKDYFIHRKGATSAYEDQLGIIPGSMGTCSYIVRGKGNIHSFKSCSHGAGRKMGRKEFMRQNTLEDVNKTIEHVVFGGWQQQGHKKKYVDYSEAPQAYKDIEAVMDSQRDLVEIVVRLLPLGVVKG